ncbi:MAG TPA: hypothetical protein RMH85_28805 [Polyangiaceae bacterium LLY-WYZ-15_(1-7)]|nr:hypothetical protein [Myxococcales bacterium]MAT27230.1 hypothetical protein [Sandaracinus sp.]HJL05525.1 hypothetical protein [Polyangiaceae bacterium LLY-WYZ-15_(1-7)]HJL12515.1 hypothetical protein [Polyangiaceae bacterium LLY-WYZ-15_(1-7)]HJL26708.1 hypothetical protein [Polyangiaceae bacterium LLY-WYZ-15_(1-7)]
MSAETTAEDAPAARTEERRGESASEPPRPTPGRGTPAGEALEQAHAAFTAGDYRRVRALTEPLLDHDDADVAHAAVALRRRTQVDPAQVVVLALCLGFFAWVVWKWVLG